MKNLFYVDLAMCGGDHLPLEFDLEEFCELLQGKVPEIEIVPVMDTPAGARGLNKEPNLVPDAVFHEALGEYCPH
jgi:hypothetical protein